MKSVGPKFHDLITVTLVKKFIILLPSIGTKALLDQNQNIFGPHDFLVCIKNQIVCTIFAKTLAIFSLLALAEVKTKAEISIFDMYKEVIFRF